MTKDEQDALMFLSQTHRGLHEQRNKRSFKIVVSTLTIFGLCVAARFNPNIKLPTSEIQFRVIVWGTFIILSSVAFRDFLGSHGANTINHDIAKDAENAIIADLREKKLMSFVPPNKSHRQSTWVWEAFIVLLGALVSAYVLTFL